MGVLAPATAVNHSSEGVNVLVADEGVVRKRAIVLGVIDGGRAEIRQGLREGESVVLRAGAFLRDGDAITPVPQKSEPR